MPAAIACPIILTASDWHRLRKAAYGHKTEHQARMRAHIVLHAARGRSNARIAAETRLHMDTVRTWRNRFADGGLPTLADRRRSGHPAVRAGALSSVPLRILGLAADVAAGAGAGMSDGSSGHRCLDRLAAGAVAGGAVSDSRRRQIWWVAGELARALRHPGFPRSAEGGATGLFTLECTSAYLALAAGGELRVRPAKDPTKDAVRSTLVRREVLGLLARVDGVQVELPPAPARPPLKAPVRAHPRSILHQTLTDLQQRELGGNSVARLRMLAIGGMVMDTGTRAGELTGQTLNDLAPGLMSTRVRRRPQGAVTRGPTAVDLVAMSPQTAAALVAWLSARARVIAPPRSSGLPTLEGAAWALWVSIRSNHGHRTADGRTVARPAGPPLRPHGLALAYSRAVTETNILTAGEPGWTPLPGRMEQLRRGVVPRLDPLSALAPLSSDAERVPVLLGRLESAARSLAALGPYGPSRGPGRRASARVRDRQHEAWAEGIGHGSLLAALDRGGVRGSALTDAGWHPALLDALGLAHRHGRTLDGGR